jgi:DNA/RNA-binding domain of Phe-tRNA-synthetase-like protein
MRFFYSQSMQDAFPDRVTGVLSVAGITPEASVGDVAQPFLERATQRLSQTSEGTMPEIQAWRRAFSAMGLKPTQYRCAAEALLRRFRKEGCLPEIHPLVDLCNAVSLAYAIPIAVYDCDHVMGDLVVCHAEGSETYQTFGGTEETPDVGEVVFRDGANHAHARRWSNRQSLKSAMTDHTRRVLIVAEALHDGGLADIDALTADLAVAVQKVFLTKADTKVLRDPDAIYEQPEMMG